MWIIFPSFNYNLMKMISSSIIKIISVIFKFFPVAFGLTRRPSGKGGGRGRGTGARSGQDGEAGQCDSARRRPPSAAMRAAAAPAQNPSRPGAAQASRDGASGRAREPCDGASGRAQGPHDGAFGRA